MIGLLVLLPNLIASANSVATEVTAEPIEIGFIVLAIIVGPVICLVVASLFGRPRTFRVPVLLVGGLILLIAALVLGFAVIGTIMKFVVPQ